MSEALNDLDHFALANLNFFSASSYWQGIGEPYTKLDFRNEVGFFYQRIWILERSGDFFLKSDSRDEVRLS